MDFQFKEFGVFHSKSAMKVGTDAILLGSWAKIDRASTILDVGTGCGVIALMTAQRNEEAEISAIDIDGSSIEDAKRNFAASPWSDRLNAEHISLQEFTEREELKFDHIVSNPPFFDGDKKSIYPSRTKSRHTIYLSHEDFMERCADLCHSRSRISIIIPVLISQYFIQLAESNDFFLSRRTKVRPRSEKSPNRMLLEFSRMNQYLETLDLTIYEQDASYTDEYERLTDRFYL